MKGSIIRESDRACFRRLEKGLIIFVDNFRVLHGRTEFDGNRTVSGLYLSRDDWISNAKKYNIINQNYY